MSVRLSFCLFHSPAAAVCGGFAAVGPRGRRHQLLDGQRRSSKCGQGYVFSVRRSLNTYLLGAVLVLWLRFRVRLVDVCDCDFWGGKFSDGGQMFYIRCCQTTIEYYMSAFSLQLSEQTD